VRRACATRSPDATRCSSGIWMPGRMVAMPEQSPAHPGEVLKTEYLDRLGISPDDLASSIRMPHERIQQILNGRRAISADTATLLADRLGTTPEFWTSLQAQFDLAIVSQTWQKRRASSGQKLPRRRR